MQEQDSLPTRQAQGQGAWPAVDRTGSHDHVAAARWVSPVRPARSETFTAALRQRVPQRGARDQPAPPPLAGFLCEQCQDAPAGAIQPAPWGGDMGVCAACQQEPLASVAAPQGEA